MVVRRAGPGDEPALAHLRWRWRVDEGGEHGLESPQFAAAFAGWIDEHRTTHLAWLAMEDDPVGMAWLNVVHRVPGPEVWTRLAGAVQSVYVVPERRNEGIGVVLMDAVIAEARRMRLDYLSVHPSEESVPFYRRLGFKDTGRVLELRPLVEFPASK